MIIVPQIYVYEPEEFTLQMGGSQKKSETFIPLLIGLGLTISLGATGRTGAVLFHTQYLARDFKAFRSNKAQATSCGPLSNISGEEFLSSETFYYIENAKKK